MVDEARVLRGGDGHVPDRVGEGAIRGECSDAAAEAVSAMKRDEYAAGSGIGPGSVDGRAQIDGAVCEKRLYALRGRL